MFLEHYKNADYFPMKILLVTEFPSLPSPLLYLPRKANKKKKRNVQNLYQHKFG